MSRETQRKGDLAVAIAIAWFTSNGYGVLLPISESAPYDLAVDDGKRLYKIQVKYSKNKDVDMRRVYYNSKGYVVNLYQPGDFDWLFVHHDGKNFLVKEGFERQGIRLNHRYILGSDPDGLRD